MHRRALNSCWVKDKLQQWIFTVGEAVRSTCGNSHEEEEEEEENENNFQKLGFLLGISNSKYDHIIPTGGT